MSYGPLMIDIAGTAMTAAERERLLHPLVGGVILFARNYCDPAAIDGSVRGNSCAAFAAIADRHRSRGWPRAALPRRLHARAGDAPAG